MTPGALPNPEPNDSSPKPKRTRKAPASREAKPAAKRGPTTKRKKVVKNPSKRGWGSSSLTWTHNCTERDILGTLAVRMQSYF